MENDRRVQVTPLVLFILLVAVNLMPLGSGLAWATMNDSVESNLSAPDLSELTSLAKSSQTLAIRIETELANSKQSEDSLKSLEDIVRNRMGGVSPVNQNREADLSKLLDLDAELSLHADELRKLIESYQSSIRRIEALRTELASEKTKWLQLDRIARDSVAPREVQDLLGRIDQKVSSLLSHLTPRRDQLLILLTRAINVRSVMDEMNAHVMARRKAIAGELLAEDREPLLLLSGPNKVRFQNASRSFQVWRDSIGEHIKQQGFILIPLIIALSGLSLKLRGLGERLIRDSMAYADISKGALAVASEPLWVSMLTGCLGLNFGPQGPVAFYDFIWLLILIPVSFLSHALLSPYRLVSVFALALAISPFPFRTILEPMPWVDRWLLNLQALMVGSALVLDWFRTRQSVAFHRETLWLRVLVFGVPPLLVVGVVSNLMGKTGLAREIIDGVIESLGFFMVYRVVMDVAFLMAAGFIQSPIGQISMTSRSDPRTLLYTIHGILKIGAVVLVIWGAVYAFRIDAIARSGFETFTEGAIVFGSLSLPLKSLAMASVIIMALPWILRFSRFMLEREVLPRFRLSAGVPFAITALSQYAIAAMGFFLAMTSLGIDLTKISILAGALGVGIGFGLQNIFNNFISGLILLFERPIHVGDVIEIGSLRGAVTRIGVRSSTIKTPTGAEVLVPNGDLIAKEVINWTLSDRRRRIEITVGVAYRTPIEKVLELLMRESGDMEEILDDPQPLAVFSNFGESSLDFVLYAWVEHYEDTLTVASALRARIYSSFKAEGIEIPYPQRNLHLFSVNESILKG
ncbi:MAG: hypothetical protein RL333_2104 [Pseudomonadota bacterium]